MDTSTPAAGWPPYQLDIDPASWTDYDNGNRFQTVLMINSVPLHLIAQRVTLDTDGDPTGIPSNPTDWDALVELDDNNTFRTTPLHGVPGASGEYLIYLIPFSAR